jgi:Phosphotransferase enzyme family
MTTANALQPPIANRHVDAGPATAFDAPVRADDPALTDAGPLVAGFLGMSGWTLDEVRPEQVRVAPGSYVLARHRVVALDRHGHRRGLHVCVEARRRSRPQPLPEPPPGLGPSLGLDVLAGTVGRHSVWVHPYDPDLTSLPEAVSGAAMGRRLRAAGLLDGPALVHARLVRYRPGRRAVVRYQVVPRPERGGRPRALRSGRALFGKVLRADRAERVGRVARALAWEGVDAGAFDTPRWPADRFDAARLAGSRADAKRFGSPTDGGWRRLADLRLAIPSPLGDGLFVAPAIGGSSLRDLLLGGGSLPAPGRVVGALAALSTFGPPGGMLTANERRHPARLLDHAVGLLGHVLPDRRDQVARAAEAVTAGVSGWRPSAFVHGDLYDDQIFVDDGYGVGLIDLDDAGPGDPAIDAANACAHLLALAAAVPWRARRLVAYRDLLRAAFVERLDVAPNDLAWREALGLLLLATGPFRVQSPNWQSETNHLIDLAIRLTSRDREGPWRICS